MAFRRGFKTEANELARDTRAELGLGPHDRLDPLDLASDLEIPVWTLSSMVEGNPGLGYLVTGGSESFSAVTVFAGPRRTIVHNDVHKLVRQASNLAHELSHALLQHPPTPPLDHTGCRVWDQQIEDEASWLAGCLLVPEPAALAIARGRWTPEGAADHFGVSLPMVRFRLNATGATVRARRAVAARHRGSTHSAR